MYSLNAFPFPTFQDFFLVIGLVEFSEKILHIEECKNPHKRIFFTIFRSTVVKKKP